jgi:two-component system, NarL family, response regulator LiaR
MTLRKSIIVYGIAMAGLIGLLKFIEYRFLVRDLSLELYLGLVAVIFVVLGVWIGRRLTRVKVLVPESEFTVDDAELKRLGITKREYEVLGLIAQGLSNQEIADRLFVSMSTVKTHTSNLFLKLNASRRTQALQRAKELRILA